MTLLGVAFLLEGLLVFCTSFNVRLGCLVYLTFLQTFDTLRFVSVFGFQGTKCGLFVLKEHIHFCISLFSDISVGLGCLVSIFNL